VINEPSGLVHKRHRRGKRRRTKLRLAVRVALSIAMIAAAAGLSAGIVHVVERPVAPFKSMATSIPELPAAPDEPFLVVPVAPVDAAEAELAAAPSS
jgi:hypothetical protein